MLGEGAPAYGVRSVTIYFEDKKYDIVEINVSAAGEGMDESSIRGSGYAR